VWPVVEGYPRNKMELITARDAKEALSVETGDIVEVEILIPSPVEQPLDPLHHDRPEDGFLMALSPSSFSSRREDHGKGSYKLFDRRPWPGVHFPDTALKFLEKPIPFFFILGVKHENLGRLGGRLDPNFPFTM